MGHYTKCLQTLLSPCYLQISCVYFFVTSRVYRKMSTNVFLCNSKSVVYHISKVISPHESIVKSFKHWTQVDIHPSRMEYNKHRGVNEKTSIRCHQMVINQQNTCSYVFLKLSKVFGLLTRYFIKHLHSDKNIKTTQM